MLITKSGLLFKNGRTQVEMIMDNARSDAKFVPEAERLYNVNYLIGSDRSMWASELPAYSRVRYVGVYKGIDTEFHTNGDNIEFDYVIAPDGDPTDICLLFKGAAVSLDPTGDLLIKAGDQSFQLKKPSAYQQIVDRRIKVEGHFRISEEGRVTLLLGRHSKADPIFVDPVISYGTYIGGNGAEDAHKVAIDQFGNAYIVGTAILPTDLAATSKAFQTIAIENSVIFVVKINPSGKFEYLTYLGGTAPAKSSSGFDIAVDASGSAYICGVTTDNTFPTLKGFQSTFNQQAALITKLTPAGDALFFSTFLAGSAGDGATAIALDNTGAVYVTGFATSADFPTTSGTPQPNFGGIEDGFVSKLSADGSKLLYSSYIGGTGVEGPLFAIAVDSAGNAYVTGHSSSTDFPTTVGTLKRSQQVAGNSSGNAFITKINSAGSAFSYSTLLGSDAVINDVEPRGIAVDLTGNAVVAGFTSDTTFPVTPGAFQVTPAGTFQNASSSAFVSKVSADGAKLVFSSFVGGAGLNAATGVALDSAQNIVLVGETTSPSFPTTPDGASPQTTGELHGFLSILNSQGSQLTFSSVIAGSSKDQPFGVALSRSDDIFVAGFTSSTDFPVTLGSAQPTYGGGSRDGFLLKFVNSRFLRFPLRGTAPGKDEQLTPATAPIITVFDHSMESEAGNYQIYAPATPDGVVQAFSTDRGIGTPEKQGCYQDGGKDFSIDIPNYVGPRGIGSTSLCYDNHPGFDYRAALGTEVYAAVNGTVHYPINIVGIRFGDLAFKKYHVLELVPDDPLPYKIFYLHLLTHPQTGEVIQKNDNTGSSCPATVSLPLPEGTPVKAGCLIALSGAAGAPHGPHLHFEIQKVLPLEDVPEGIQKLVQCLDDIRKACVPVDPYGWSGNSDDDPYTMLTTIALSSLWK
ncbi:MAG: SBBP repeat-containing protein [Terriglobales bacterium]